MKHGVIVSTAVGCLVLGLAGCQEQTPRKVHETTIKTPAGTTTITIEKDNDKPADR